MKRSAVTYGLLFAILMVWSTAAVAQQDYEERRRELLQQQGQARGEIDRISQQIQRLQNRIVATNQSIDSLANRIENLNRLIALQEDKVGQMESEQNSIRDEIAITNRAIDRREEELRNLMEQYKETLTYLYKHGRTTELALLFSSRSLNQMLQRAYYLEKFDEYLQGQVGQVKEAQARLQQTRVNLIDARERNRTLLADIQEQKQQLDNRKEQFEDDRAELSQDREQRQAELQRLENERNMLHNGIAERSAEVERITRLIAEGGSDATASADGSGSGRNITPAGVGYLDEETFSRIETEFEGNKGTLSWPVESSTISEHFGRRRHPVYGTVTNNLGIEIITNPGEQVRAVHEGQVFGILPFPGYGDVVMVMHGRFVTAYGNLSETYVRDGTILQEGDVIGRAGRANSPRGESLFFLVREGNTNLDPEAWLRQK